MELSLDAVRVCVCAGEGEIISTTFKETFSSFTYLAPEWRSVADGRGRCGRCGHGAASHPLEY